METSVDMVDGEPREKVLGFADDWTAVGLLATSWLFLPGLYGGSVWPGVFLALSGSLLLTGARLSVKSFGFPSLAFLIFAASLFAATMPIGLSLGPCLVAVGAVVTQFKDGRPGWVARLGGLADGGAILSAQSLAVYGLVPLIALRHDNPAAAVAVRWILGALGAPASRDASMVFVGGTDQPLTVVITQDALGWAFLVAMLTGATVWIVWMERGRVARLAMLWFTVALFSILRLTLIVLVLRDWHSPLVNAEVLLWNPYITALSFAPLVLILRFFPKGDPDEERAPRRTAPLGCRLHLVGSVSFVAGVSLLCLAWCFHDPGERKKGSVIIDEAHSDWEWTEIAFDTSWYGQKSVYNYYCLREYLSRYYPVNILKGPITAKALRGAAVLILKTPTRAYATEEIRAIETFVKRGGGLLMVGDHTNVFGMSSYLNPVAHVFGLHFREDATYEIKHCGLSLYKPPKFGGHPVVTRVPYFLFATSCTLDAVGLPEFVMLGAGLRSIDADYSRRNFFPKNARRSTRFRFGAFLQAAGVHYGKGRVLGFTDSTVWSNFSMFMPGKPELLLGIVEWLMRSNRWAWVRKISFRIGLALFLIGVFLLGGKGLHLRWMQFYPTTLLAVLGVCVVTSWIDRRSYRPSQPLERPRVVHFVADRCEIYLPDREQRHVPDRSYQTFYVWCQRVGLTPAFGPLKKALAAKPSCFVFVNPTRVLSGVEVEKILSYVRDGGKLLIMDDPRNLWRSTSWQLLKPFGIRLRFSELPDTVVCWADGDTVLTKARHIGQISGGVPLLKSGSGHTIAVWKREGAGTVVAVNGSHLFSDASMGSTSTRPDGQLRRLYRVEFVIWQEVFRLGSVEPRVACQRQGREGGTQSTRWEMRPAAL